MDYFKKLQDENINMLLTCRPPVKRSKPLRKDNKPMPMSIDVKLENVNQPKGKMILDKAKGKHNIIEYNPSDKHRSICACKNNFISIRKHRIVTICLNDDTLQNLWKF